MTDRDPDVPPLAATPAGPRDFASVKKRITSWTLNGLATALVLVLCLAGGRQVLQWWVDEATPAPVLPPPLPPPSLGQVQLGEQAIAIQHFTGARAGAITELKKLCQQMAVTAQAPTQSIDPSEQRLLQDLALRQGETHGDCRAFELTGLSPMVAVTRDFPASGGTPTARVVAMGLALPVDPQTWSLYVFPPRSGSSLAGGSSWLPLPPGAKTSLALRPDDRQAVITFIGPGTPDEWQEFFTAQQAERHWQALIPWESSPNGRFAVFSISNPQPRRLELNISAAGSGQMQGVAIVSPSREEQRP